MTGPFVLTFKGRCQTAPFSGSLSRHAEGEQPKLLSIFIVDELKKFLAFRFSVSQNRLTVPEPPPFHVAVSFKSCPHCAEQIHGVRRAIPHQQAHYQRYDRLNFFRLSMDPREKRLFHALKLNVIASAQSP